MPARLWRNAGAESAIDGGADGGRFGGHVDDVARAFAALLANADVDDGQGKRGSLHDAAGGVADERIGVAEEAPVGDGVEIDEDVSAGAGRRERAGALDERVAAGVGVGVNEEDLAGRLGERGEEGIGFGVGVAQDGDGMPGGDERGRRERQAETASSAARSSSVERRRWSSEGAPARCTRQGSSPMAMTRWRAVSVDVKWMCASLVRALRTASSMAPWLISPPSMWAMGMRRARAVWPGREHLVAVGDEQQQIGTPGGEGVGKAENGHADGLGHAGVGVGAEQALDARAGWESRRARFR